MNYIFMNKNTQIAKVKSQYNGKMIVVEKICNPEYAPFSFDMRTLDAANESMYDWWNRRKIPSSRDMLATGLNNLGLGSSADTAELMSKAYGLSLTDQYWLCPEGSNIKWEDVNFFKNDFSDDIGEALFDNKLHLDANLLSPDSSLGGGLRKKWKIVDGKRCLVKAGSSFYPCEPYNEVFSNMVCDKLGITDYVKYTLDLVIDTNKETPVSICECFIDSNTELVTGIDLISSPLGKQVSGSLLSYDRLVSICEQLGIDDIRTHLSNMFLLDILINNQDRHYNNFGLIRDVSSLKFLGIAPIFDNGTSMYARCSFDRIKNASDETELSFVHPTIEQSLGGQCKYITVNPNSVLSLLELEKDYYKLYSRYGLLDENIIESIWDRFKSRIDLVKDLSVNRQFDFNEKYNKDNRGDER